MGANTEVVILTPTPNEYRKVSRHIGLASFRNLAATVVECGPGKINAAFAAAREILPRLAAGERAVLVGAGTSGSLSLDLTGGDIIASPSAVISDWRREDGRTVKVSPYGWFDYREADPHQVERMVIECRDSMVLEFMGALSGSGLKIGRMLTSDTFIEGRDLKLSMGSAYGCLACDMESGAFGYVAGRLMGIPWFNLRVVADTLDDGLADYFAMEGDITDILGRHVVRALTILDGVL
jgi:nucleoside phosphorylase